MKKRIFLAGMILPLGMLHAQQDPTNTFPNSTTNGTSSNQFWSRAGNTNQLGTNNIFGTLWDSPIYLRTNGLERVQFFSNQGSYAPTWVTPLPSGGGMGISLDPTNPIRNPLSLLHIGEHLQSGTQGGYRSWMQVGTFIGHRSDQFYIGTKPEASTANDRTDAVINWGDNTNLVGGPAEYGPDYLRFIFTAPFGGSGYNTYAAGNDGLEIMRLQPDGSVGVGNFYNDVLFPYKSAARRLEILSNKTTATGNGTPIVRLTHTQQNPAALTTTGKYAEMEPRNTGDLVIQSFDNTLSTTPSRNFKERYVGINTANPGNTLEINSQLAGPGTLNGSGTATGLSGLRFTDLNSTSVKQTNPGTGCLALNTTGDVIYVDAPTGATGPAGPAGPQGPTGPAGPPGSVGAICGSPASAGALAANTRLELNANNFYFSNLIPTTNTTVNKVAVGYNCSTPLPAKFNVYQKELGVLGISTIASHADNRDIGNVQGLEYVGSYGIAQGNQFIHRITNTGGSFEGRNAQINIGVKGYAWRGSYAGGSLSYGGSFNANDPFAAYGVRATAYNSGSTGVSYGIYATASGGANTLAGYFQGDIMVNTTLITSDSMFKTNVTKLNSSLNLLQALKPVSYKMDNVNYPQMNFDNHLQFGFIAQDVEQVFPSLVYDSYRPSSIDSLGNPIDSAVTYKSLNYTGLIPINTAAIIELNNKVDAISLSDESIKTNVQDLTGSLDKVLDMRGVSYDWNHTVHPELNLDSLNQVGFIAQEIQVIDPRLTFVANDSLLHVKYEKVVPILAEAIQELNDSISARDSIIHAQSAQITDLNNRLTNLENCLSALLPTLCSMNQSLIQNNSAEQQALVRKDIAVTLSNKDAIVLDQNVPNPFAEQTVINFSIPETVKKAQIHFYDGQGKLMQSVDIADRGLGNLTVFGSDLSSGVYTYTLVADGQVVATKKMMKQ